MNRIYPRSRAKSHQANLGLRYRTSPDRGARLKRQLFKFSREGYLVTNTEGVIEQANPAVLSMLAPERNTLIGTSLLAFVNWRERGKLRARMLDALSSSELQQLEMAMDPDRGPSLVVSIQMRAIRNARGDYTGFSWVLRNITNPNRLAIAVREANGFSEAVLDALSAHIAILDCEGTIIVVNRAWKDFAQRNSAHCCHAYEGWNYLAVCDAAQGVDADMASEFSGGIRQVIAGELREYSMEYSCHSEDACRWFMGKVTRFPGDGPLRIVVAHEDITERKFVAKALEKAIAGMESIVQQRTAELCLANQRLRKKVAEHEKSEAALRESETRFRQLAESVREVFFLTDPLNSRFEYVSPAYEQIWGRSCESLYQDPRSWVDSVHPDDLHRLCPIYEHTKATGESDQQYRILWPDGTVRWIRTRTFPVRDETGKLWRVAGISEDVTETRLAEEALRQSELRLRDLSSHLAKVRDEESAHMAREIHDELGSTLTGLKLGLASLAILSGDPADANRIAASLMTVVDQAIANVKRLAARLRPAMLDTVGLKAAIECHAREFTKITGIPVSVSAPKKLALSQQHNIVVFRVVQEALTNVGRHAAATQVAITLRQREGKFTARIADNGQGIQEEELSRPGSYGILGMRERCRSLGGEVEIRGVSGKGTTVLLRLPLQRS